MTGGTGLLGRLVVERLVDAGREVRIMSRRPRSADDSTGYAWATADLRSGHGARDAVAGVDVVVRGSVAG
ncbi:NAD(P)H-binding protein [Protofrankia symbiont of Coriaria ruscifolia]|uniref:NAD(P)H-binding protein n=1 Tax=Protofrankia symbiont of Coriaria ruscifolia TaxID=1306542 RepID=UPI0024156271|nr:NAD(P)H-binding protein [Protofrankia symbiont of Coriaria ruscifolia]